MTKETLIRKVLKTLSKLPQDKVHKIADFADYIQKKYDDELLQNGIQNILSNSKSFEFLQNDKDIYTAKNLKI